MEQFDFVLLKSLAWYTTSLFCIARVSVLEKKIYNHLNMTNPQKVRTYVNFFCVGCVETVPVLDLKGEPIKSWGFM